MNVGIGDTHAVGVRDVHTRDRTEQLDNVIGFSSRSSYGPKDADPRVTTTQRVEETQGHG